MASEKKQVTGRRNKHHRYTPEQWTELVARAEQVARDLTAAQGSFTREQLRETMSIGTSTDTRLVKELIARGTIVDMDRKGLAAFGMVRNSVTLQDLLDLAVSCEDPGYKPAVGRKSATAALRVDRVSPSQLKDIRSVVSFVAKTVGGGNPEFVGSEHFAWSESGGPLGGRTWDILSKIATWSDEQHRAAWTRKGKRSWNPDRNEVRKKHLSAMALLLNLAATHGLIEQGARHNAQYQVHAAEWQAHIDVWVPLLVRQSARTNVRKPAMGCRTLALYATRRGELQPDEVNWEAVKQQIEAEYQAKLVREDVRTHTRWAYNQLIKAGVIRTSVWQTHQSKRSALVTTASVRAAAERCDFSAWQTSSGEYPAALIEGPYGLRSWVQWSCAADDAELRALKLPPREWLSASPAQTRQMDRMAKAKKTPFKLTAGVLRQRLHAFALFAGWLEKEKGTDWTVSDLRVLVDPMLVEQFACAHALKIGNYDRSGDPSSSLASVTAFALATLASPYLENRALQAKDQPLAATFRQHAEDLKRKGVRYEGEDKKKVWAIEAAWKANAKSGWHQLGAMRDLMIRDLERIGGGSLPEQIEAIRQGAFTPTQKWAILARDACIVSFLRVIPVRVRSLVELTFGMWRNIGTGEYSADLQPWQGGIKLELPATVLKSKRPFEPFLFRAEHIGNAHREADLRRDLWELYLMPGGARDEVLRTEMRTGRGESGFIVQQSNCVFPALARRGGGHGQSFAGRQARGFRMDEGSASTQFGKRVMQYAPELGMHKGTLKELWGATALHVAYFGRR